MSDNKQVTLSETEQRLFHEALRKSTTLIEDPRIAELQAENERLQAELSAAIEARDMFRREVESIVIARDRNAPF